MEEGDALAVFTTTGDIIQCCIAVFAVGLLEVLYNRQQLEEGDALAVFTATVEWVHC